LRFDSTSNKPSSGSADKALSKLALLGLLATYITTYLTGLRRLYIEVPKVAGAIFLLSDISRAAEVVPVYGSTKDTVLNTANSLELVPYFYFNSHADKEIYHALFSQFA